MLEIFALFLRLLIKMTSTTNVAIAYFIYFKTLIAIYITKV